MHFRPFSVPISDAESVVEDAAGDCGLGGADAAPAEVSLRLTVRVLTAELVVSGPARHHEVLPVAVRRQRGVAGDRVVQDTFVSVGLKAEAGTGLADVAAGAAGAAGGSSGEGGVLDDGVRRQEAGAPGCLHTSRSALQKHRRQTAEERRVDGHPAGCSAGSDAPP